MPSSTCSRNRDRACSAGFADEHVSERVRPTTPRAKAERRERRPKKAAAGAESPTDTEQTAEPEETTGSKPASKAAGDRPRSRTKASREGEAAPARRSPTPRPARPAADVGEPNEAPITEDQPDAAAVMTIDQGGPDVSAEQVGEEAARFLDGLVEAFGLSGTSSVRREGDEIEVLVEGDELGLLIGPRGSTLLAVQDLTRVVSQRRLGDHETRLRIDIGGYRERRRAALTRFTEQQAEAVLSSGQARALEPMPSADRKVIHDTVAGIDGVSSRSEGEDPFRRVVIVPSTED